MDQWREFRINKSQRGRLSNTWNWFAAAMPCSTSSTICIVSLYFVAVSMINGLHQSVSVSSWVVGLAWFWTLIILVLTILIITGLNLNYQLLFVQHHKLCQSQVLQNLMNSILHLILFNFHDFSQTSLLLKSWNFISMNSTKRFTQKGTCLQIKI